MKSIKKNCLSAAAAAILSSVSALPQAANTYTYNGPTFLGGTDHVSVSFTTNAPLSASTSYLSQAAAGVTAGSVSAVGPSGPLVNFTLPITTFQVHTDATGAIDSWYIFGDFNNLAGTAPTMTGTDWQAYTMNTLAFIPGSDIPGAVGLVTGPYDYDQATETTFYTSCTGAPAGCTLAGNGQPYVGNYSGIINPSQTSGSSWTVTTYSVAPPPTTPPVAIVVSGSLPNGQVNTAYSASLAATGGTAPYTWSWTGTPSVPAGLSLVGGVVSGTPKVSGSYTLTVTATDSTGAVSPPVSYSVVINPAPATLSCTAPKGASEGQGQARITEVGAGYIKIGSVKVNVPSCAKIYWNGGAQSFAVGQDAEWEGYSSAATGNVATIVTIN